MDPDRQTDLVDELIERYMNDALDAEGLDRLSALLRSSEDAARRFAQAARFDHALYRHFARASDETADPASGPRFLPLAWWRQRREHLWGPAAALAIHAALIVLLVRWAFRPSTPRRDEAVAITLEDAAQTAALDRRPPMPDHAGDGVGALPSAAVPLTAPIESDEPPPVAFVPSPSVVRGLGDSTGAAVALSEPHWTVRNRFGEYRRARRDFLGGGWAEEADRASAEGVAWLAARQLPGGAWSEDGADAHALTSLAGMALLARGVSPRDGLHAAELRAAMTYIVDGLADRAGPDPRTVALRLGAIADAVAISRLPALQTALGAAVNQALATEHPGGGWGMSPAEPDPVVTAWMTAGLRVAHAVGAGDERSRGAIARAAAAVNQLPNPAGAGLFYPDAEGYAAAKWSRTAGSVLTLMAAGETSGPRIQRGLRALDTMPPSWPRDGADGATAEAFCLATMAHMSAGGADGLRWISRLAPSLLAHRRGDAAWSAPGRRPSVRITAMAVLILETAYRYPPAREWGVLQPELPPAFFAIAMSRERLVCPTN